MAAQICGESAAAVESLRTRHLECNTKVGWFGEEGP